MLHFLFEKVNIKAQSIKWKTSFESKNMKGNAHKEMTTNFVILKSLQSSEKLSNRPKLASPYFVNGTEKHCDIK